MEGNRNINLKHPNPKNHGPSRLADRPNTVSALQPIQLLSVLVKDLVIGQFSFSLFFNGRH